MNNLKVMIPLKTNSTRVENKNLRPFHGEDSLFDVKAKQLIEVFDPKDVYVSSENPSVRPIVEKYGFNFHLRDVELTTSSTIETNLVHNLVSTIPDKSCDVLWCQVTQPMFDEFRRLLDVYNSLPPDYDSICVVKRFAHHLVDERGNPVNFNFGYWHKISQDLPKLYQVAWAAFIMRRKLVDGASYQIGRNPYLFESERQLVDIDTPEDFRLAQLIYKEMR